MRMEEALRGVSSILMDSAPAIYHLERHPRYAKVLDDFFRVRSRRGMEIITSPVTLAECLVQPVRKTLGELVASYRALLLEGEDTTFHIIGEHEAQLAAEIRVEHNLRLPDAFQVAVARLTGCEAILTNDTLFRRVDHPRAIILNDFVGEQTE